MSQPFEQATRNLIARIDYNPHDIETIQRFLLAFAEHILWDTTPASGNTIKCYQGMTPGEIARHVPDMPEDE